MNEVLTLKTRSSGSARLPSGVTPAYAELMTTSNFSFLRSGSHAEELVGRAASLGLSGLGLCDRNSFAGVVRAHVAMRDVKLVFPDFRYVVGTRLVFVDGTPDIIAYPSDRAAYGRLCKLLTTGNLRAGRAIARFTSRTSSSLPRGSCSFSRSMRRGSKSGKPRSGN
jgi:DNA polymerase III alpha subunit